jgi:alkylation response protein AidB-like acyl-CoA dehydrogenase
MTATSQLAPTFDDVRLQAQDIAARWAAQRGERQHRTSLYPEDFAELQRAGVHLTAVPAELGGLWAGVVRSTRSISKIFRTLAKGDPSVALVTVMHPAVLQPVLAIREAQEPYASAWEAERRWIFETILGGAWWGTIGSEPGKNSDRERVSATARLDPDGRYRLSGRKHFATGSGIASYMVTSAVPSGETSVESFYLDMRGVSFDGSAGARLIAPWDGHGMAATQSHALEFEDFPATRSALPGALRGPESPFFLCAYIAVVLGVVESAIEAAGDELERRGDDLHAYEQVEWTNAGLDAWLMVQAFEGMLRSIETRSPSMGAEVMRGKVACGQLAESALTRICRVVGARSYSRSSPFGNWFEDVRALGFLRPGWRTAFDDLIGFEREAKERRTRRP